MSYRIDLGQSMQDNLHRIAGAQLHKAREALGDRDLHKAVHQVRQRCKKLRGLLRLFRFALGDQYDIENAALRDAARSLSDLRDATAVLEALDACRRQIEGGESAALFDQMDDLLCHRREEAISRHDTAARLGLVEDDLRACAHRVADWQLDDGGFAAVRKGLQQSYSRARRGLAHSREDPTVAGLHDWRKRVKYHRYHIQLLQASWPKVMKARRGEANKLGNLLGDDHDLAILGEQVLGLPCYAEERESWDDLLQACSQRRLDLQARAFALGAHLFMAKSKVHAKESRAHYRIARSKR